jgi:hypothetical protein
MRESTGCTRRLLDGGPGLLDMLAENVANREDAGAALPCRTGPAAHLGDAPGTLVMRAGNVPGRHDGAMTDDHAGKANLNRSGSPRT